MKLQEFLDAHDIKVQNMDLIEQAFTHASYVNETDHAKEDNERLEFMGDAVLQICVSERLFNYKVHLSEGDMTLYRAKLVNEKALAQYTLSLGINEFLKLGMGEEKNNGRTRTSTIADVFESFIGALYLDSGFVNVNKVLDLVWVHIFEDLTVLKTTDYKTKLQEYIQSDSRKSVSYHVVRTSGPSNAPLFEVVVKLDDLVFGKGEGKSKKQAEQAAAEDAFNKLVK